MKTLKLFLVTFLLCAFFPILSYAAQSEDAKAATALKDKKVIQYEKAMAAIADKDYKKACELLAPLAGENPRTAKNDLEAKTILAAETVLGTLYFKGEGVEPDVNKGLAMIMDAAKQGHEQAKSIAAALNRELALMGNPVASYNVGYMCLKGWGGKQDPNKCVEWLEKAAESGHAKSARILSQIYAKGKYGIAADQEKANHYSSLAKK